jgi:hypothetical protein
MRALHIAAGLALTAALAGCSDDSDDKPKAETKTASEAPATSEEPTASEGSPEQEVEAAYHAYVEAFLTGDGATAYALLSERCQSLFKLSEFAEISEQAAELYGLVDYEIKSVTVDGDRAVVDAEYPVEALNQGGGTGWVLESGEWRDDKCD